MIRSNYLPIIALAANANTAASTSLDAAQSALDMVSCARYWPSFCLSQRFFQADVQVKLFMYFVPGSW